MSADDVTHDILAARTQLGYDGDDAIILNALLADKNAIRIRPDEGIGQLNIKTTVYALRPNTRIKVEGSKQSLPWVRDLTHTGSTLVLGNPNGSGAGSAVLENLWMVHPHRCGFYQEPGNSYSSCLPNRLTDGQSMIEIHGGQSARIHAGGYGCQHFISVFGGAGVTIDSPFTFGGIWDDDNPGVQEGLSQIRFTRSPTHGHGTSGAVITPLMYGGNASNGFRNITVGAMNVQALRRYGPRFGVLLESCEDFEIIGGFSAGFAHSNFGYVPVVGSATANVKLTSTILDESNRSNFYAMSSLDGYFMSGLKISGTEFNGQVVTAHAVDIVGNGRQSVARMKMHDCTTTAHLSAAMLLYGVDGGEIHHNRHSGYNMARNILPNNSGAGIIVLDQTSNVSITDTVFGGGINRDSEVDCLDSQGMTSNGCQIGFLDGTTGRGNTYARLRARNLGVSGGAVATGGTLDHAA